MSQSPTGSSAQDPQQAYLDAWQQLARRIQLGQSFSGRERNCVFLNTHGPRFADVSSIVGLDLIDDSRSVALTDWDGDGDLDLWLSNRTGPRVRYLENKVPNENQFISFRLEGDPRARCPRDAIGARVELTGTDTNGTEFRRIQTLSAGNGFLSQSSKTLFFGLAAGTRPTRVTVRWPGSAQPEEFTGIAAGDTFKLEQGQGKAELLPRRAPVQIQDVPESPRDESPNTRVWLSYRLQTQALDYQTFAGQSRPISTIHDGPILVTLWASWCAPCLTELQELGQRLDEIQAQGARVVALNVEGLDSPTEPNAVPSAAETAQAMLAKLKFDGESGMATEPLVEHLNSLRHAAIYRQDALPIPSSFLIDASGELCVMYTGQVSPDQLLDDLAHLNSDAKVRRSRAVPFEGRWADDLFVTNAIAIANIYRQDLQYADAIEYLQRFVAQNPVPDATDVSQEATLTRMRLADVHQLLGRLAVESGSPADAMASIQTALTLNPRHAAALEDLGDATMANGRTDLAVRAYQKALEAKRDMAPVWNKLGLALMRANQIDRAVQCFQQALRIDPSYASAANNLAWLWATCPDEAHRRGPEAVKLAEQLVRSGGRRSDILDTLAAAYAEAGNFERAIATAQLAIEAATAAQQPGLAERITQRLQLYQANKPFRDEG